MDEIAWLLERMEMMVAKGMLSPIPVDDVGRARYCSPHISDHAWKRTHLIPHARGRLADREMHCG